MLAEIKPYTTKDLSVIYKISYPRMRTWIKNVRDIGLGECSGQTWSIKQVQFLFEYYGHPSK